MQKSVLILGGEGFLGVNIQDTLHERCIWTSSDLRKSLFRAADAENFLQLDPYVADIQLDYACAVHLIDNATSAGLEFRNLEEKLAVQVLKNQPKKMIVFSSAVLYANPNSEYGQRKKILEEVYTEQCKKFNVPLVIFRLFNTYGRYQLPYRQGSLVANIICNHLLGKQTELSSSKVERDFIFAGDIGKFVMYALENDIVGTFDLSSNTLVHLGQVVKILEEIVGGKIDIRDNQEVSPVSPAGKNPFLDKISLTSFNDGLRETVEFYKDNLDIIRENIV